jgi:hypothetical protein
MCRWHPQNIRATFGAKETPNPQESRQATLLPVVVFFQFSPLIEEYKRKSTGLIF